MSREDRRKESHRAIVEAAARAFRQLGYPAAGVDGIMADAALTHGGFYAHFSSKEELFAEALEAALTQTQDVQFTRLAGLEGAAWAEAFVATYASPQHAAAVGSGCPIAALAADVSRAGPAVRGAFARGMRRLVEKMGERTRAASPRAHDAVLASIAMSVGAVVLARALRDTDLADAFLAAVARFARNELGPSAPRSPLHPGESA
jgi:TetR/AcrR family transcriptional repressor of nem operon